MDFTAGAIFLLAFTTGLLHALDADHVMAVTAIASKKLGMKAIVRLCLQWSLGHGAVLFIAGAFILIFGLSIPHELSHYAEKAVAIVLIMIGLWVLKALYQSRAHIHFHQHDGLTNHAHWHVNKTKVNKLVLENAKLTAIKPGRLAAQLEQPHEQHHEQGHDHSAVMVGIVHGMAGLAPLLAIIPIANQPVWLGIVYLFIFCAGVFLSMLVFGGVLGKLVERVQDYGVISINVLRGLVGLSSISLGLVWLV